jgi:hypothetical protein
MILAVLLLAGAVPTDLPVRSPDSYTEAEIYTEPHAAAAAAISTQNFIVGRMSQECTTVLAKPESYAKERAALWESRNKEYFDAAVMFASNSVSYAQRIGGDKEEARATQSFIGAVRTNGAAAVKEMFDHSGSKREACDKFEAALDNGSYDIVPGHPFYKEANELVQIQRAFKKAPQ